MRLQFLAATAFLVAVMQLGCQSSQSTATDGGKTDSGAPKRSDEAVEFAELEGVDDPAALKWVEERNVESKARLTSGAEFQSLKSEILTILQAKDRIPSIEISGEGARARVRNFWQDKDHVRGIYREQSLADFRAQSTKWETILDLDALAAKEKESWVFKGMDCAPKVKDRCLLKLSRGGGDAVVVREFDLKKRDFVAGGFSFPEGKVDLNWKDDDHLWAGLPLGPGTVSTAGYPITVRVLERGQKPESAAVVASGQPTDVSVWAMTLREGEGTAEKTVDVVARGMTFYEAEFSLRLEDGSWKKLPLPVGAELQGLRDDALIFSVRKSGSAFGSNVEPGAIYGFDAMKWRAGKAVKLETVFVPTARQAVSSFAVTKNHVLVIYLDNVVGRLAELDRKDGVWQKSDLNFPNGVLSFGFANAQESFFTVMFSDRLTPTELYVGGGIGSRAGLGRVRTTPARFNAKGMRFERREAKSKDGTKIPYMILWPKPSFSENKKDSAKPTLIDAYGGFENPSLPYYSATIGKVWVERGGVSVIANIRGGGEFGPKWHQAALKENRQRAFDDLYAVAEDLIQTGVTTAEHLGFRGGSNGGLLAGVALTQRPDLFAAILAQVPLFDMLRYHTLLAGASWMGEYGNPDVPLERAALQAYSPFHNLKAGTKYPEALVTTSTRDDRVHPGHARRMVAKMRSMGLPVLYFENTEGGHAGAATLESRAGLIALEYRYLWEKLK